MSKVTARVVGVGNGGTAAVSHMIGAGLAGVEFITMNTSRLAADTSSAPLSLLMGEPAADGRGSEGRPDAGRRAAERSAAEIRSALAGADLVILVAGLGGGTGTGALPVIARVAREAGALAVAVVSRPFSFEGPRRAGIARAGVAAIETEADTAVVLSNDRLLHVENKHVTPAGAYRLANDLVLRSARAICDIVVARGGSGVRLPQLRDLFSHAGGASVGSAYGSVGEQGVRMAAEQAVFSPLLDRPIRGARRILVNVTSGPDLTPIEAGKVAAVISETCGQEDAAVVFGWVTDPTMARHLRVTVVGADFADTADNRPARPAREARASQALTLNLHLGDDRSRQRGQSSRLRPTVRLMTPEEEARVGAADGMDIPGFLGKLSVGKRRGQQLLVG